jgi:hypothetical protein
MKNNIIAILMTVSSLSFGMSDFRLVLHTFGTNELENRIYLLNIEGYTIDSAKKNQILECEVKVQKDSQVLFSARAGISKINENNYIVGVGQKAQDPEKEALWDGMSMAQDPKNLFMSNGYENSESLFSLALGSYMLASDYIQLSIESTQSVNTRDLTVSKMLNFPVYDIFGEKILHTINVLCDIPVID